MALPSHSLDDERESQVLAEFSVNLEAIAVGLSGMEGQLCRGTKIAPDNPEPLPKNDEPITVLPETMRLV